MNPHSGDVIYGVFIDEYLNHYTSHQLTNYTNYFPLCNA